MNQENEDITKKEESMMVTDNTVVRPCPCGCLINSIHTREQKSLALHVMPSNVLHYQGNVYRPDDISSFWKKDCRMFLWKNNADKCHSEDGRDHTACGICKLSLAMGREDNTVTSTLK